MSEIYGNRLREERVRITPKQSDFASILGVRQSQLSEWEKGSSGIKAEHLSKLAAAGIDVLFVLTGQRGGELLPLRESRLLDSFRRIDAEAQDAVVLLVDRMADSQGLTSSATIHDRQSEYRGE